MTGVRTLSDAVRSVGETVAAVHFETDPEALAERLPDPFELIQPGEAFLYHGEAVIRDPDLIEAHGYLPPRLSTLFEAGVLIPCELDGRKGGFFTGHHADRDWSARKFRQMGYSSDVADIKMTRFPGELREFTGPESGQTVKARTSKNGQRVMESEVTLEGPGDHPWDSFVFTVFGRRHIEDETLGANQSLLVNDVTAESHGRATMETVWEGSASINLHRDLFDDLQPVTALGGYLFEFGLGFEGMEVLWEGDRS